MTKDGTVLDEKVNVQKRIVAHTRNVAKSSCSWRLEIPLSYNWSPQEKNKLLPSD